ncbi:hypothetical protein pb186bvf_018628 [Paramecium bursaria]
MNLKNNKRTLESKKTNPSDHLSREVLILYNLQILISSFENFKGKIRNNQLYELDSLKQSLSKYFSAQFMIIL